MGFRYVFKYTHCTYTDKVMSHHEMYMQAFLSITQIFVFGILDVAPPLSASVRRVKRRRRRSDSDYLEDDPTY